jgi:hypothetical protein
MMPKPYPPVLPNRVEGATRWLLAKACGCELTLATAESCTGGMLANLLTDVQRVAHAFDRGFVTYSEEPGTEMLGVPADLIEAKIMTPCAPSNVRRIGTPQASPWTRQTGLAR